MSQSLSRVIVHGVYSTKNRDTVLGKDLQQELYPYLATVLKSKGHMPIKIGGHVDHVHALYALSRTETIAKSIEDQKVSATKWIKQSQVHLPNFKWQGGYAIFGVSEHDVDRLVEYISNQDFHHTKISFQDELRQLLKEHNMEYDERYLWD